MNRNKKGELNGTGHTGIIIAYDTINKIVYSVDGNVSDRVSIKSTPLNYEYKGYNYIDGFCSNGGTSLGNIPEQSSPRGGSER